MNHIQIIIHSINQFIQIIKHSNPSIIQIIGTLNETDFTGSFHGVGISSETTESLFDSVGSDEGVATIDFDTVEGFDGSTDLLLVGARIAGKDEGVVVFDATHGTFRVDWEFDDGMGISAGDNGNSCSTQVLWVTRETKSARETESARSANLATSLGISSTKGSFTSTFSLLNNNRSVYKLLSE